MLLAPLIEVGIASLSGDIEQQIEDALGRAVEKVEASREYIIGRDAIAKAAGMRWSSFKKNHTIKAGNPETLNRVRLYSRGSMVAVRASDLFDYIAGLNQE